MSNVRVEVLAETAYSEWEALVKEAPAGSVYSLPVYLDVLCAVAGGRFRILGVRRGDALVAGVALYERPSGLGVLVMPRLLLYYNGIVLRSHATKHPSEETARQLEALAALAQAIEGAGYATVELRSRAPVHDVRPFLVRGWAARPSYTYVVPLTDLAAQWQRVEQNLRRLVKRCGERERLALADDDDFDDFYRLHLATLGRKGVATYLPHAAFQTYYHRLKTAGLARVYHCRLPDGRSVASQLVLLGPHPVTHTVSAAGDPELNRLGGQAFLRWKVFETLAALGYAANDLTDATLNPVTHFKAQLGGRLELALTVHRTDSLRYTAGRAALDATWWVRSRLGDTVRRLGGRTP